MAKRIVIADDSATIQRAFAMTFGAEDVTLVAARSAEEGLALTRQLQPDLVIADGMMPGRSGYDLCAQIKADPSLSATAVYVLASAQQPYDESRGRQSGADGHLLKPFDTTAIIEKVHLALAKGPTEIPEPQVTEPISDDYGPPMPSDARAGIPHGLTTSLAAADDDDEYGEISVDMSPSEDDAPQAEIEYAAAPAAPATPVSRPSLTPPPYVAAGGTPAPAPAFQAPAAAPMAAAASMRPSLIPGIRPGAVAPARPGAAPARPATPSPAPAARPPAPIARTLMGLPAANIPIPGTSRPGGAPPMARPTPPGATPLSALTATPAVSPSSASATRQMPVAPPAATPAPLFNAMPSLSPTPPPAVAPVPSMSAMVAVVGAAVDQKIAALGARGPEYEAIARLSREIIEQIVWEVVPELAEVIIREHVERHVRA